MFLSVRSISYFFGKNGARFLPLEGLNFLNKDFLFNAMGVTPRPFSNYRLLTNEVSCCTPVALDKKPVSGGGGYPQFLILTGKNKEGFGSSMPLMHA